MKRVSLRKRPFILLELMIAFIFVTLVVLPLLTPSRVLLLMEQNKASSLKNAFVLDEAELTILESLYKNELPLEDVLQGVPFTKNVRSSTIQYFFTVEKKKPKENPSHFVLRLTIEMIEKERVVATKSNSYFLKKEEL